MKMKMTSVHYSLIACLLWLLPVAAQTGYQAPQQAIVDLVDAKPTPVFSLSPNKNWALLLQRPSYPSIEELARPELRIGGLRIDPATNGASRENRVIELQVLELASKEAQSVKGLPADAALGNFQWSPDGKHAAFTHTTTTGIELWILDIAQKEARRVAGAVVNGAMRGAVIEWFPDSRRILFKGIMADRGSAPAGEAAKPSPVIQQSSGVEAPVRTYQDLLSNAYEAALFDYYTTTQLYLYHIEDGSMQSFSEPGIVSDFSISPDGNYVLMTRVNRPYSYLVPYYLFPQDISVYDMNGAIVKQIAALPLAENIPTGFDAVRSGPRSVSWRSDKPAMLYWVEALDQGDPKMEAPFRDQLYSLGAPFSGNPEKSLALKYRLAGLDWHSDALAVVRERWRATRMEVESFWSPAKGQGSQTVFHEGSSEDRYNNPGSFMTTTNAAGYRILLTDKAGAHLFLEGEGASPEGDRPFLDIFNMSTQKSSRLWRSAAPYYASPLTITDADKGTFIMSRESSSEVPNYYVANWNNDRISQLTRFENPYKALDGVRKEIVQYERADGVTLTGTLYLPAGYDQAKDGPLPTFMWAYPREFKSAAAAAQISGSPYRFTRLSWGSPVYWVTQGYAVFDNFSMPIIGEGDEEPNETFVAQLQQNAAAAIDKLVGMGVTDRNRIGVGGHSYGAFMTANLLAHTDLFAAGIARSGAYNRTLTPFGFQNETRTYWEAPEIYNQMSPFMHANNIKEPILLIHGEADNNSGTFPIQSQRFYAALKGHGANARLVMLPHESHGYQARESILHTLSEMDNWLSNFVKNRVLPKP
ncbi:MAG: prolyl oligopeptidase family serine peptidase [Saprospiraceae bacterium]|nr:prolyl oligopeptidase family serine peptidase [Saprospiraceae bacterium]